MTTPDRSSALGLACAALAAAAPSQSTPTAPAGDPHGPTIEATLQLRPDSGSPLENKVFTRHQSFHVDLCLHNTGEQAIAIPTSGHQGEPSIQAMRIRLVDPAGVERRVDLGSLAAETPTGTRSLDGGRKAHRQLDIVQLTRSRHWEWWSGSGLPPGAYRLSLEFAIEAPTERHVVTEEVGFEIVDGDVFPAYRPEGRAEVLERADNGEPTHVAWFDEAGCRVERLYLAGADIRRSQLHAEIVHAVPGPPGQWTREQEEFDLGAGAAASCLVVQPTGRGPTAEVRMWAPQTARGTGQMVCFRLVDGVRHGAYTASFAGRDIVGDYDRGERSGVWIVRRAGVPIVAQHYERGLRHGSRMEWHASGGPARRSTYDQGELDGVAEAWAADGTRIGLEHWQRGVRHGAFTSWSSDGTLRQVREFDEDTPSGTWRWFDQNGDALAEGTWRGGKQWSGTFIERNRSAARRPDRLLQFENGRLTGSKELDRERGS